ncbi:oocyte zinc finger protein XlCOF19 [Drosophila obscura]|uniref:oocyte zinc finger protein XlCOF19 n=1 Tax=Drosophila obscura TaxID=7282 RepID=UPI001BB1A3D2|nr:oocyte zinc finger protein XlCOF19 [Drosophila obscura]
MDITLVCRICANKIKDKKRERHVFKYMRGKLLFQLKMITGVELSTNQGLPEFVCERCFSELDLAVKFRERCIFSQKYLLDMVKKSTEEDRKKYVPTELHEQLIDPDQLEPTIDDDELFMGFDRGDDEEFTSEEDPQAAMLVAAEEAHKAAIKEEQMSRAAKRRRNFFICEQCGQFYDDEYSYNEHLDAHQERKEMKMFFPCTECPETFTKKTDLKQHRTRCHIGQRHFKCSTCGEVFVSMGAKLRHEKAHENERPYPCLQCGKIFTSVSDLSDHHAVHTATKMKFKCEPCSKDFMTKPLLMAHIKTRTHHRAVRQIEDEINFMRDLDSE